jgi:uncharacterized protein YkwD
MLRLALFLFATLLTPTEQAQPTKQQRIEELKAEIRQLEGRLQALRAELAKLTEGAKTSTLQDQLVQATNVFRKENKLLPLVANPVLMKVAQGRAENLARHDKLGDDGKNGYILEGKDFAFRVAQSEYNAKAAGENVGMVYSVKIKVDGTAAVSRQMNNWKDSSTHRKNMLTVAFTEVGVGIAQSKSGKWYLVQVFATPM